MRGLSIVCRGLYLGPICPLLALLILGCAADESLSVPPVAVDEVRLIDNFEWSTISVENDPFWEAVSEPVPCPPEAHAPDPEIGDVWYTVETRLCNYLSVQQSLKVAVKQGDTIELRVYQSVQVSGTEFILGIAFGDEIVATEAFSPAPTGSGMRLVRWVARRDWPAGTRVVWNVSNDGVNSWSIITLTATSSTAAGADG